MNIPKVFIDKANIQYQSDHTTYTRSSSPIFSTAKGQYFAENPDAFTNNDLKQLMVSAEKYKLMERYRLDSLPSGLAEAIIIEKCRTDFTRRKARFIFKRILSFAESKNAIVKYRKLSFLETIHIQLENEYLLMSESLSEISHKGNDSLGCQLLNISQIKKRELSYTGYMYWKSNVRLLSDYFGMTISNIRHEYFDRIIAAFPIAQQKKVKNTLLAALSCHEGGEPKYEPY